MSLSYAFVCTCHYHMLLCVHFFFFFFFFMVQWILQGLKNKLHYCCRGCSCRQQRSFKSQFKRQKQGRVVLSSGLSASLLRQTVRLVAMAMPQRLLSAHSRFWWLTERKSVGRRRSCRVGLAAFVGSLWWFGRLTDIALLAVGCRPGRFYMYKVPNNLKKWHGQLLQWSLTSA
jgi:hypothetical protein